jgi:hypothetical protein
MARRQLINNKVKNGDFTDAPTLIAPTTSGNKWIDGTATGSVSNNTYGWYSIVGVGSFQASLDSGILKMECTTITGRGRVMTCPFESSTTPQNIQNYGINVQPSTSYTLTARIKGINVVSSSSMRIAVQQYSSSGTLDATSSSSFIPAGDSDYTTYTVTFTTPATVSYANIYISVNVAGTVQSIYVDDVKLDTTVPTTRTITTTRTLVTNRVLTRDMGTALSFDGVSNKVAFSALPITMALSETGAIFRLNESATPSNRLAIIADTANQIFVFRNDSGGISSFSVTNGAKRNIFTNLVIVESSTGIRVYVNGVLVSSSGTVKTYVLNTINALGVDNAANWFKGIIDEPRIWNRALTTTEIANMYFNNIVPRTGLVGEWLFNETTGTTALDSSDNGNNGIITGATYVNDPAYKVRTLV